MAQILLIESEDSMRSILKLNLMKSVGCDVIETKSAVDAISLLEILPNLDLVICREQVGIEKTAFLLANLFEKENKSIPLMVIGKAISQYKHLTVIDFTQPWQTIVLAAGKVLGMDISLDENRNTNEYVPVGVEYFLNITSTSMGCDVFIRVKKGDDHQYIKRLYSTDSFTREDIGKYISGGLKDFYILRDHFSQFVNFATSQLTLKLENKNLSSSDRIKLTSEAYEITLDRINTIGVDEHTVEIIEESIRSMQVSLEEENALSKFLQALRSNKLSYAYSHCYLCSLILHKVVSSFDWDSAQVKEKFTYVAYFHDISLKENLMKFNNEEHVLKSINLNREERELIMNHANKSAAIIEKFQNVPPGVAAIVKEHHGAKSGIGFPTTLSIAISPMSMMFVVVENFVDEFLKIDGAPQAHDFERIFELLKNKYDKVTYEQTVNALQKMVMNKR